MQAAIDAERIDEQEGDHNKFSMFLMGKAISTRPVQIEPDQSTIDKPSEEKEHRQKECPVGRKQIATPVHRVR